MIGWTLFLSVNAARAATPDTIAAWQDSVVLLMSGPSVCAGVAIDDRGTIATAYHCVASGIRPQVRTRSGDEARGRIVAVAPKDDLALVLVPGLAGKLPPRAIEAAPPAKGTAVTAIGHPFAPHGFAGRYQGLLLWSVSAGIVSAVNDTFVQTDVALNPGNSGGPLFDDEGAVIGIVSRKFAGDGVSFAATGTNLAALRDDPQKASWLGGELAVGVGAYVPATDIDGVSLPYATVSVLLRDQVVLAADATVPLGLRAAVENRGTAWVDDADVGLWLRARLGHGLASTTFAVGGGVAQVTALGLEASTDPTRLTVTRSTGAPSPFVGARVGMGSLGLRGTALELPDGTWTPVVAFELEVPGVVAVF